MTAPAVASWTSPAVRNSYVANPRPKPKSAMRKGFVLSPIVWYPASDRHCASVFSRGLTRRNRQLPRDMPGHRLSNGRDVVKALCAVGKSPVNKDAMDALVYGA